MQFLRNIPIASSRFMSSCLASTPQLITTSVIPGQMFTRGISGLANSCQQLLRQPQTSSILMNFTRSIIRIHFPRPKEHMRIRKHGWKKRMSTESGRKIIMKRILKGRHALTH